MVKSEGLLSSDNYGAEVASSSDMASQELPVYPKHKEERLRFTKMTKVIDELPIRTQNRFKNLLVFAD